MALSRSKRKGSEVTRKVRREIMERDKDTCVYCGNPATQIDHITPVSHYRENHINNLVASCRRCNLIAWNFIFDDFTARKDFIINQIKVSPEVAIASVWLRSEVEELGRGIKSMVESTCVVVDTEDERKRILDLMGLKSKAKESVAWSCRPSFITRIKPNR